MLGQAGPKLFREEILRRKFARCANEWVCARVCAHSQTITQKAPAGEFESTFSILRQDHPDYTASENMPFSLRIFLQEVAVRFFVQKYDFSKSFSSIVYTLRHTRFTDKPEDEALRDICS